MHTRFDKITNPPTTSRVSPPKPKKPLTDKEKDTIYKYLIIGFFAISIFYTFFLLEEEPVSTEEQDDVISCGGSVQIRLAHRDDEHSELGYVIYFDDEEGPSGTIEQYHDVYHPLCTCCDGEHVIEVYWTDGDDCQDDIVVSGGARNRECTNYTNS